MINAEQSYVDWENYDDICSTYTKQRRVVGLDDMLRFFAPTADTTLLDAGCGTGNYICALMGRFGYIRAGDFNAGMLRIAEARYRQIPPSPQKTRVDFAKLNICNMQEIAAESFDCAINCQVIHHLPKINGRFEAAERACREWYRVLKPGGKMVINFVTHEQQMDGVWWGELIPDAVRQWQANAPDRDDLRAALVSAGFTDVTFVPVLPKHEDNRCVANESLYDDALYLEPMNFLDIDTFRRSDSTFALATKHELAAAVRRVQDMADAGVLRTWFLTKDRAREQIGMTTNAYITKQSRVSNGNDGDASL